MMRHFQVFYFFAVLVIFEVQHLPYRTSRLFQLIRMFCRQIFSSTSLIMVWGGAREELRKFTQFMIILLIWIHAFVLILIVHIKKKELDLVFNRSTTN